MNRRMLALALAGALALGSITGWRVWASQGSGCMPTTGTVSGLSFAQDVNTALAALISSNSGASAPATDCSAAAVKGQFWLDTSSTPNIMKQYDGTSWTVLGFLDGTGHVWTPPIGGGTASLASASTTDLWSVPQAAITVTGTTGITALANSSAVAGTFKIVKFAAATTLSYNATSLILPGAADIPTNAGDYALVVALGPTNVAVVHYAKADGTAVVNPAIPVGAIINTIAVTAPAKYVLGFGQALTRTSYPDYLAAVTSVQSAIRTNGSPTLTGMDTSLVGPGMPVEGSGIPSLATIVSCSGSSACTLSQNATSSGTGNVTFFITGYGAGGSVATVGVPDCRNMVIAGRGNMGGVDRGLLTSTYLGAVPTAMNATGGGQSTTFIAGNLPAGLAPSGTISQPTSTDPVAYFGTVAAGSSLAALLANNTLAGGTADVGSLTAGSVTAPVFTGNSLGGSSTPFSRVQPTLIANCMVRVLSMLPQQDDDMPLLPLSANDNAPVAWRRVG